MKTHKITTVCDQCKKSKETPEILSPTIDMWFTLTMPHVCFCGCHHPTSVNNRQYDFCSKECLLKFFEGVK
jgi:hypothetical protein